MNGMDVMIIEKTTSSTDKLAKSKANYEKTYYRYLALSMIAGVMLTSCASDEPATQSTTTTRQTTVTQPSATQTTTQTIRY